MRRSIRDLAGIIVFAIALGVIAWRCWTLLRPEDEPRHPVRAALADFQDVVYYPARAALAGVNPYDARVPEAGGAYLSRFAAGNTFPLYAPLIFVFALPLAVLPLLPAEIIYWLLNVGLLLFFARVLLQLGGFRLSVGTVAALGAILLLSRPGHANAYFGAITLPMALATIGAWSFAFRPLLGATQWMLAAFFLAIALIKPTFGGPLLILLLLCGSCRAASAGLALAAVANLAVMLLLLPHELTNGNWFELLAHNQAVIDADSAVDPLQSASRIDFLAVVERLWGHHLPGWARFGVSLLLLVVAGWNLRQMTISAPVKTGVPEETAPQDDTQLLAVAFVCLTIAICIYHNIYDALLAAPTAILASCMLSRPATGSNRGWGSALLLCAAVPALNYVSSRQFSALVAPFRPALWEGANHGLLWALFSSLNGICLMAAWCLLLVMIRRRTVHNAR